MNRIYTLKKIIHLWIAIVTCTLLLTAVAGADPLSRVKMTDDTVVEVDINALVMEVSTAQSYIVIAEKRFEVRPFSMDGESGETRLTDSGGNAVKLGYFKEGQRVFVEGFEFTEGKERYVAERIQLISQSDVEKDYRRVEKLDKAKPE